LPIITSTIIIIDIIYAIALKESTMSQVTIYLEDDALAAAKEAAKRAHVSVSKWFAQFAEAEKQKKPQSWDAFFAELDALKQPGDDTDLDFLLGPDRYKDLGTDAPREQF
jgi:hypothetical protein